MNPLIYLWIILVIINFSIQLAYYRNDTSARLFIGKKVTTPLLLFLGLFIVITEAGGFPVIPALILAAMGIGELGIEGSSVVQSRDDDSVSSNTSLVVTLAGVLFLLVNVFIGSVLIYQNLEHVTLILLCLFISLIVYLIIYFLMRKVYQPAKETNVQIALYLIGVVVLSTGTLTDLFLGMTTLGLAAAILTVSDTLVLIRMGANYNKNTPSGYLILLAFLIGILLLYYLYMAVLIHMKSPFLDFI